MARPVNANAEATRRRILSSALAQFSEGGAGKTSIRDIARAADVSLAMVHHYFGSKDALYVACIDSMYAELFSLRTHLEGALRAGGSVDELLERAVRTGFRFARAHRTAVRLLLRDVVDTGELDARRRESMQQPFLAQASGLLSAALGRPAGELRLTLQSVVALTARYAISSEAELEMVTGLSAADDTATQAVEDHLVGIARALLGASSHDTERNERAN